MRKMIEGDTCPGCEKGKLRKVLDRVEKGIKVAAFKCGKCDEVRYSKEIMENGEILIRASKV